jgi:rubrerythrin
MAETHTIDKVLDTALRLEIQSERVYRQAAQTIATPGGRALLEELADEELRHKAMLEGVQASGDHRRIGAGPAPSDLRVADLLSEPPLTAESTTQDILLFAIKREQAAVELYTRLAQIYAGTEAVPVIERLVREEKLHRERLEREYEETVLKEN